jgi:hypothetical protein
VSNYTPMKEIIHLRIENRRMRAIVDKLPAKNILTCCRDIELADLRCSACDGPVQPTASEMSDGDMARCLAVLWECREAAEAALAAKGKTE